MVYTHTSTGTHTEKNKPALALNYNSQSSASRAPRSSAHSSGAPFPRTQRAQGRTEPRAQGPQHAVPRGHQGRPVGGAGAAARKTPTDPSARLPACPHPAHPEAHAGQAGRPATGASRRGPGAKGRVTSARWCRRRTHRPHLLLQLRRRRPPRSPGCPRRRRNPQTWRRRRRRERRQSGAERRRQAAAGCRQGCGVLPRSSCCPQRHMAPRNASEREGGGKRMGGHRARSLRAPAAMHHGMAVPPPSALKAAAPRAAGLAPGESLESERPAALVSV